MALAALLVFALATAAGPPPELPEPRANNPVARVVTDAGTLWFTGLGLTTGKTWRDLRADGWIWSEGQDEWRQIQALPAFRGLSGRLGSHAAVISGSIYVIGGYTVSADHTERSTPGIWKLVFDPEPGWKLVTRMPVPVDDSVALVLQDRYLYLVSGWSDTGNVNLVQIWDSEQNAWTQAEPWPGAAVFGHAGGMVGYRLVICGGARIKYPADGPRQFIASDECWLGTVREDDMRRLDWKPLPPMPGGPRYRAGAVGTLIEGAARIIFAGGADRPYNYDGTGYDGNPADAFDSVVSYNLDREAWECREPMPEARMDLRGLLFDGHALTLFGGLDDQREVRADAVQWSLAGTIACNDPHRSQDIPEQSVPEQTTPGNSPGDTRNEP